MSIADTSHLTPQPDAPKIASIALPADTVLRLIEMGEIEAATTLSACCSYIRQPLREALGPIGFRDINEMMTAERRLSDQDPRYYLRYYQDWFDQKYQTFLYDWGSVDVDILLNIAQGLQAEGSFVQAFAKRCLLERANDPSEDLKSRLNVISALQHLAPQSQAVIETLSFIVTSSRIPELRNAAADALLLLLKPGTATRCNVLRGNPLLQQTDRIIKHVKDDREEREIFLRLTEVSESECATFVEQLLTFCSKVKLPVRSTVVHVFAEQTTEDRVVLMQQCESLCHGVGDGNDRASIMVTLSELQPAGRPRFIEQCRLLCENNSSYHTRQTVTALSEVPENVRTDVFIAECQRLCKGIRSSDISAIITGLSRTPADEWHDMPIDVFQKGSSVSSFDGSDTFGFSRGQGPPLTVYLSFLTH